ncbi:HMA2 domain-containing protein [Sporomusa sp.]|uniref:HMA2 domain-containing protein n=1 Tax=Sporomusa sp. TaxID=2078658 RepID=UPI002D125C75|nr:hypothetical protein [Sporomusa sp.]HWR07960.1 hypothetical protein [Sporomusa sp.]
MTYLTGLALGISAGRQLSQLMRGNGFSLVHALPGRRRYQHDDLLHNKELAGEWRRHLVNVKGINQVKVSPETGSLLVEYTLPDEHIDLVMEYLEQLHKLPGPRSDYGKMGMDIQRFFRRLNRNIFKNTASNLDLRTIMALLMLFRGGAKMWNLGQRPSGPQMIWWAYSLLKGRS